MTRRGRPETARLRAPQSRTQSTSGRPRSGWRCFGVADFIRVPRPAAMTTAARGCVKGRGSCAGAERRLWLIPRELGDDAGTHAFTPGVRKLSSACHLGRLRCPRAFLSGRPRSRSGVRAQRVRRPRRVACCALDAPVDGLRHLQRERLRAGERASRSHQAVLLRTPPRSPTRCSRLAASIPLSCSATSTTSRFGRRRRSCLARGP